MSTKTFVVPLTKNFVTLQRMDYADRLKKAINSVSDMNQSALARTIGVKPQAIQYLCSGKAVGSKYTSAIADALNINAQWLENGHGQMHSNQPTTHREVKEPIYGYLDEIEQELIDKFRQLNDEHKSYILGSCSMYITQQKERKNTEAI